MPVLPLKKVLCPIDFSQSSLEALDSAAEFARHFDAELCVLHVLPLIPPRFPVDLVGIAPVAAPESDQRRLEEAREKLSEIARRLSGPIKARCEVRMGYADKEIAVAAEDECCDLLVISTHGLTGWRHLVFGSVAEAILRAAKCPVLTVHATPPLTAHPVPDISGEAVAPLGFATA